MVYIKNWKTKTEEEIAELWPKNHDSKYYVILTSNGIEYHWDVMLR